MRIILIFAMFLPSFIIEAMENIIIVPKTLEQVNAYAEYARADLEQAEKVLSSGSNDPLDTHRLMQNCGLKAALLACLSFPFITLPEEVKESARGYAGDLMKRYHGLLASLPEFSLPRPLFTPAAGTAPFKSFPQDRKITVLSWNICCLDGGFPMLFGGVLPWRERIDGISDKILEKDADIICLQEVFSEDCVDALYERLKKHYAYFYLNIGPKKYSFDPIEIRKISSGLFVASKYPLDNPSFYPYDLSRKETEAIRGYGAFTANLFGKIRISTTHLQPGPSPEDKEIRNNQLLAIRKLADSRLPMYVFADTNIEKEGEEYKKIVSPYFYNHYQGKKGDWTCCELRDSWLNPDAYAKNLRENSHCFESIDSVLEVKRLDKPSNEVTCEIVSEGDLSDPEKVLSDHRALYSTITLPEE